MDATSSAIISAIITKVAFMSSAFSVALTRPDIASMITMIAATAFTIPKKST